VNDWLQSLEARERLFVIAGGVAVVCAVLWFALWMPLERGERNLAARISNWQSSLSELRPLRQELPSAGSAAAAAEINQSLVVIVDNTLRARNLYNALQRSQPTTSDGIRVEFENIAFDDLVLWLGELAQRYGLQVQSASFTDSSANGSGRVNASVTLER